MENNKIEIHSIEHTYIESFYRSLLTGDDKDYDKQRKSIIMEIEKIVRSTPEYRSYIRYLKQELNMNKCEILQNVDANDLKVSLELHHYPFTLFDIVATILDKHLILNADGRFNEYDIAEECLLLHHKNKIGLIPLAGLPHDLYHAGKLYIPLSRVYMNYKEFFEEYKLYMDDDIKDKYQTVINLSNTEELELANHEILKIKLQELVIHGLSNYTELEEHKSDVKLIKDK